LKNRGLKKDFFYLFGLLLLVAGCRNDRNIPDVSDIAVAVKIQRFEQDLFVIDTNNAAAALQQIETKYPAFSAVFFDEILDADNPKVALQGKAARVVDFTQDPFIRHLYDTVQVVFPDLEAIQEEFKQAFQFYKYYFPDKPTPTVTTFVSGLDYAAFIYGEDALAVGLDGFLGADFPYAQYNPGNPNFSAYLTRTFNKEHLVAKTLQALINDLAGVPTGTKMLDLMIYNGKKLYVLDKMLPYTPDSVKLEITAAQTQWLTDNELEMWSYFIKENLLYSSDYGDIRKYVEPSPNSPGMPPEAPGRTANWLGWQIVKAYMNRHPDTTLPRLLALQNAQALLDGSKYKPKR
jgi:hypothetical protein